MMWKKTCLILSVAALCIALATPASALSHREDHDDGSTTIWFQSAAHRYDEALSVMCLIDTDLSTDYAGTDLSLREDVTFVCDEQVGEACESDWLQDKLNVDERCGDEFTGDLTGCEGTFGGFSGYLKVEPQDDGRFLTTWSGDYDDWEGTC